MCAHLRLLTVHSPGRQFAQPQLANAFVSFVERLEGRKGGEKGDGKESRWAEPIRSIFKNTRIETRSFLADPIKGLERAWKAEEVMPKIIEDNTKVASEAISRALSACSMKPSDIDNVFFSSPLFSAPAISVRAMNHLPFRKDVKHWPMMGLGCVGGVALLSRATDYLRAFPTQSVLTLTVESGSRFWYGTLYHTLQELLSHPKPNKEKVMQQVLLAALFGDAVSCSILYGAESPFLKNNKNANPQNSTAGGPTIVDYVSLLVPNSEDLVSHHVESSGLQSYLSSKLGSVAPKAMVEAVEQLLQKHKLRKEDISHWFVHAGGPKMLTYFENEYGLKNHELKYCWKALAEVGNVSSATVPRTYELATASEPKSKFKNSYGIMVAAGPGLTIEAVLLKWT